MASKDGHTAIIVALVEEGGADVNVRGGEQGDTPLMLSVRPLNYYLQLSNCKAPSLFIQDSVKVELSNRAISCVGVKLGNAILPQNVVDYRIFTALRSL